jgi:hypothetical protein
MNFVSSQQHLKHNFFIRFQLHGSLHEGIDDYNFLLFYRCKIGLFKVIFLLYIFNTKILDFNEHCGSWETYKDLTKQAIFKKYL